MTLVPSLLQAIIRLEGEAVVMHVGDRPYVVTPGGQVDLATRGLTFDAVTGIVNQLLPIESQRALDEIGATQYELPAMPEFPGESFTIVAAYGGDNDVWAEIRRRRAPDEGPMAAAPLPREAEAATVAQSAPPQAVSTTTETQEKSHDLSLPDAKSLWPGSRAAVQPPPVAGPTAAAEPARPVPGIRPVPEAATPAFAPGIPLPVVEEPVPLAAATEKLDDLSLPDATVPWPDVRTVTQSLPVAGRPVSAEPAPAVTAVQPVPLVLAPVSAPDIPRAVIEELRPVVEPAPAAAAATQKAVDLTLPVTTALGQDSRVVLERPSVPGVTASAEPAPPVQAIQPVPVVPLPVVPASMSAPGIPRPVVEEPSPVVEPAPAAAAVTKKADDLRLPVATAPGQDSRVVFERPSVQGVTASAERAPLVQAIQPVPVLPVPVVPAPTSPPGIPRPVVEEPAPASVATKKADDLTPRDVRPFSPAIVQRSTVAGPSVPAVQAPPPVKTIQPVSGAPALTSAPGVSRPVIGEPVPVAPVLPLVRSAIRCDAPPPLAEQALSTLDQLLRLAAARGAAMLYLSSEARPSVRVDGEIFTLDGAPILGPNDVESLLLTLMPERNAEALRTGVASEWICDLPDVGRVRCLSFRDHRGPGGVFRMMPVRAVTAEQIGLSREVEALMIEPEGLVLVAGPRASGKRTLMSAFVDYINHTRRDHVISIETEINVVHERDGSFISQREIRGGVDEMWAAARGALREDPDVLVLEEVRSAALMNVALEAAASGQLVICGFPARDATGAIDRIIDLYPAEARRQVQLSLAQNLRGVVSQVLLKKHGGGRVAAREILLNTPAVASALAEGRTSQLPLAIEGGRKAGMMSLNDALVGYVQSGLVDVQEAYRRSANRSGFVALLKRQGVDTSALEKLA